MRSRVISMLATGACAVLVAVAAAPAQASYPGTNGKLVFVRTDDDPDTPDALWTANPDGTGQAPVGGPGTSQSWPVWSPDGSKIAFTEQQDSNHLYTINADGSGASPVSPEGFWTFPTWRIDGLQLAATRCYPLPEGGTNCRLAQMNNDGSGYSETARPVSDATQYDWSSGLRFAFAGSPPGDLDPDIYTVGLSNSFPTNVTNHQANDTWPSWSPDSGRIAFVSDRDGDDDIWVINGDGSGVLQLTDDPAVDSGPVWSPDGTKIAFWSTRGDDADIYVMNADGSSETAVITGPENDYYPDWQPVPPNAYARPKGATPFRVPLVVAFNVCAQAGWNRVHGPPLDYPSCSAPQAKSSHVTVGTPDVNGAAANMMGAITLDVITGNPATPTDEADVRIRMDVTDVRCREAFTAACGDPNSNVTDRLDYVGDLVGALGLRITDKDNDSGDPQLADQGTVQETSLSFTAPCVNTASTDEGATCSVDTTVDALVPGMAHERNRAIWRFGQALVFDGGSDGDASTPAATGIFLVQGIFVP